MVKNLVCLGRGNIRKVAGDFLEEEQLVLDEMGHVVKACREQSARWREQHV